MRKIAAFLLAGILCLSLLGCAMGDGYGKYANIYRLLDAGDYEGAHAAIDALAGILPTTVPEVTVPPVTVPPAGSPTETTEAEKPTDATPPTTAPADPEPVDPSKASYVLNTSSKRIHKLTCGSVETIKEGNRIYTDLTREELIELGYESCGRCKP